MAENEIEDDIIIVDEPDADVDAEEDAPAEKPADGSVDSSDDDAEEQRKKKRKRGGNPQAKIKELWQREQDSKAEIAHLKQAAHAEKVKAGKYQEIAVNNAEANLTTQKKLLEQELRYAHEVADSAKIAKITSDLSQVQADEAQLKRYKMESAINATPALEPEPKQAARAAEPTASTLDDLYENGTASTRNWLDSNREWFDSESEDFDEEKAGDVADFARNLERKLAQQGRAEEVQTASYYRRINEYIKENWSDSEIAEDVAPVKKTFNRGNGGAAPVISRAPNTQRSNAKKEIKMSVAERNLAVSLNLRHPNGVDYTDAEKIKAYVSNRT